MVKVAVTLFAAAISFASEAVSVPLTVAVVPPLAVTASVTNAAFTCDPLPVIV